MTIMPLDESNRPFDKYDAVFLVFRLIVFLAIAIPTFFMARYSGLWFSTASPVISFIATVFFISVWIVVCIGVGVYLMLFTRNTFRMYAESKNDTDEEEDSEDTDAPETTPATPGSDVKNE